MTDPPRTAVAEERDALVRALWTGTPPPRGLDDPAGPDTTDALLATRAREVADAWPQLARALGPGFRRRFLEWAAAHPAPTGLSTPWADGLAFSVAAVRPSELDSDALTERQRGRARAVVRVARAEGTPSRVRARRGPRVLVAVSRGRHWRRRHLLVTATVARGRPRTWCVPRR